MVRQQQEEDAPGKGVGRVEGEGGTRCVRTKETYTVLVAAVLTPLCQHCVCEKEIMRESDRVAWHIRIYHLLEVQRCRGVDALIAFSFN